ncbi:MAG: hypothetical protein IT190_07615 [Microbacteriaceae bacterium]|nr:hypothetical protein [Microbacteriaceae bacterium]
MSKLIIRSKDRIARRRYIRSKPLDGSGGGGATGLLLDSLSPAAALSPARKLLTAYSGPLKRIRRASDDAEMDIGYGSDGLYDQAAQASFCGASIGYDVTWYDQSGNGHHLSNAEKAKQWRCYSGSAAYTKNSRPVAWATGTTGYMQSASGFTFTALSSCGVAQWSLGTNGLYQFGAVNVGGSVLFSTTLKALANVSQGAATIAHATGTFNQVSAIIKAASRRIWKDGTEGTPAVDASTLNQSNVGLTVGALSTTTYGMAGYFGDQVFFTNELSDTDRQAIEYDQKAFWGTA